jgi:hypothetical protein
MPHIPDIVGCAPCIADHEEGKFRFWDDAIAVEAGDALRSTQHPGFHLLEIARRQHAC